MRQQSKKLMNRKDKEFSRKKLRNHTTSAEAVLWSYLKSSQIENLKFRRQQSIGPYVVDFYCPEIKLVIELDGQVHADDEAIERDEKRSDYLKNEAGLHIIRFENLFVFRYIETILQEIKEYKEQVLL